MNRMGITQREPSDHFGEAPKVFWNHPDFVRFYLNPDGTWDVCVFVDGLVTTYRFPAVPGL